MDFLSKNLPYLLAGISVGGQYALIAIGYTMVYGILRLINFAHGDIFMVAGLVTIYSTTIFPLYVSIPLTIVVTVVLGAALCGGGAALLCAVIRPPVLALLAAIPAGILLYAAVLLLSGEVREEVRAVAEKLKK